MIVHKEIESFRAYLKIEKSLSENSIQSYISDIEKLINFIEITNNKTTLLQIDIYTLKNFVEELNKIGLSARSQARIISGIRAFYKYLLQTDQIETNPAKLLEMPNLASKLPIFLSIDEVDKIEQAIDLSKPEGHRNKAIIETLYSCGLRVSELIGLKLSNLFFDLDFIKVVGKGDKERLVPISEKAKNEIRFYIQSYRNHIFIHKEFENYLFLNRRGRKLSRVMIFHIVKELAELAEIKKNISPHTFRHSFATHLVDGGANLRAVQEMLGHESIITTEIYTHLSNDYLKQTIIDYHPRSRKNMQQ
ncbi:MAG: site-specific tyrosine recombinase XerD [Bacteroidetes bacterium 4572_117]|nr:MAG: site-specific tyrosine recombinase XerD [Bacteroidetes bacterium 4572_117]